MAMVDTISDIKRFEKGDQMYIMLFNIVDDMLAILIARAKEDDQVNSLIDGTLVGMSFQNYPST
jgi:hypothetical protein